MTQRRSTPEIGLRMTATRVPTTQPLGAQTPDRDSSAWQILRSIHRVAGSALLFATFGVGAVILAGVWIPWRTRRGEAEPDQVAQRCIQRALAAYIRFGAAIRMWDFSYSGAERIADGPHLVVANHPTLLDVVFLLALLPQGDCVVKGEAWSNPALRGIVSAAGYIPNVQGTELVETCCERLLSGRSVVLFPEGTRSAPGEALGAFKRGAAHIALRSGVAILPVVIQCQPPALKRGMRWYSMPAERLHYTIAVQPPVRAEQLIEERLAPSVAARRVTSWLHSYFEARLSDGETR